MKKLVIIALALMSVNALAANKNSSWKEIYDAGLTAQFPSVAFDGTFVKVDNVCVDGDTLKTVNPVIVCAAWNHDGETSTCARYAARTLSTARSYMKSIPVGEFEWEMVKFTYPTSYQIPVGYEAGEGAFEALFDKAYVMSNCR